MLVHLGGEVRYWVNQMETETSVKEIDISERYRAEKKSLSSTQAGPGRKVRVGLNGTDGHRLAQMVQMAQMPNTDGTDEFDLAQMGQN